MTDDEVKDFIDINIKEYVKSTKENRYSKLSEKQNLRKVHKSPYVFLTTHDKVEKYAKMIQWKSTDNFLHHYNIMILNLFHQELNMCMKIGLS